MAVADRSTLRRRRLLRHEDEGYSHIVTCYMPLYFQDFDLIAVILPNLPFGSSETQYRKESHTIDHEFSDKNLAARSTRRVQTSANAGHLVYI